MYVSGRAEIFYAELNSTNYFQQQEREYALETEILLFLVENRNSKKK